MRTHSKVRTDELPACADGFPYAEGWHAWFLLGSLPKMECGINRVASSHLMVEEKTL